MQELGTIYAANIPLPLLRPGRGDVSLILGSSPSLPFSHHCPFHHHCLLCHHRCPCHHHCLFHWCCLFHQHSIFLLCCRSRLNITFVKISSDPSSLWHCFHHFLHQHRHPKFKVDVFICLLKPISCTVNWPEKKTDREFSFLSKP